MKSEFDLRRARLLVDEISANLATLPADTAAYAQLRAEVDALKAMLDGPDASLSLAEDRISCS